MCTIEPNHNIQNFLQIGFDFSSNRMPIQKHNISPSEDPLSLENNILEDDWGTLDFNISFLGEYKILSKEPKKQ